MRETVSYRNIWRISYPLIVSFVATTVINVTDTAFMGRISEVAIGAVGLGGVYFLVFLMAALGLAIGAQIIMARYDGEKRSIQVGHVFDHLIYLMTLLAILLVALHFLIGSRLLSAVIDSQAVLDHTLRYLNIRVWAFIPAFGVLAYRAFFTGVSFTMPILFASVLTALMNILLNYGLVFGRLGMPEMGLEGAAYASVLSEVAGLGYLAFSVLHTRLGIKYGCFRFPRPSVQTMSGVLRIAFPVMVQHVASLGSWFTFFLIVEGMGERSLAVSNIVRSGYSVLMVPLIGIGQATQTLVSNLIGQGGVHLMPLLIRRLVTVSLASSLLLVGLNLIHPQALLSVFTNDIELIHESEEVVQVISVSILFFAVAIILLSVVSGTGNTRMTLLIEVCTLAIYLSFAFATVKLWHWPLHWVWSTEIVYFLFIALFAGIYIQSGKCVPVEFHTSDIPQQKTRL